jgi:hypothetical protein
LLPHSDEPWATVMFLREHTLAENVRELELLRSGRRPARIGDCPTLWKTPPTDAQDRDYRGVRDLAFRAGGRDLVHEVEEIDAPASFVVTGLACEPRSRLNPSVLGAATVNSADKMMALRAVERKGCILLAAVVLALGFPARGARAGFWTGNDFVNQCTPTGSQSCYAYVAGVSDAIAGWGACLPSGISVGRATDLVVEFLQRNQQQRSLSAATAVTFALSEAFPCKR